VKIFHELDGVVAVLTGHDEYLKVDAGGLKGLMGEGCHVVVDGLNVVDANGVIREGGFYMGIGREDRNGHSINNQT